jgi:ABC-type nickel/cobalt efflux system permease component RcnA
LLFLLALGIVAFLTANALLRPADNWMPVRTMVLVSIGTFVVYPYPFRRQLVAWAALLASLTGLIWAHWVTMPSYERVATGLNVVLAGVLGMLIARNRAQLDKDLDASLEREREATAERERATAALRRLEGIIPICAYCHQVRTEAGAWEQLDQYVRSRTDADFSHGVCPACAQKHFPDLVAPGAEQAAPSAERI